MLWRGWGKKAIPSKTFLVVKHEVGGGPLGLTYPDNVCLQVNVRGRVAYVWFAGFVNSFWNVRWRESTDTITNVIIGYFIEIVIVFRFFFLCQDVKSSVFLKYSLFYSRFNISFIIFLFKKYYLNPFFFPSSSLFQENLRRLQYRVHCF